MLPRVRMPRRHHVAQHWHGYVRPNRERLYDFLVTSLRWPHAGNPRIFPGGAPAPPRPHFLLQFS